MFGDSEKIGLLQITILVVFEMLRLLRQCSRLLKGYACCKWSSWKVRNVWKNMHTANNSYLVLWTHCKTDRSKGCNRLRVLILIFFCKGGGAGRAPPQPPVTSQLPKQTAARSLCVLIFDHVSQMAPNPAPPAVS